MELRENRCTCTPIGISTHVKRISGNQEKCAINNVATEIYRRCLEIGGIEPKTLRNGSMKVYILLRAL